METTVAAAPSALEKERLFRRGVLPALLSAVLMWMAQPPLGFAWLIWFAPLGLVWLAGDAKAPGRSGYFAIWIGGCFFWLATLQGIRLAYWPLIFGWIAMSLYLAVYWPLFVGITRILTFRWGMPLVLAAPISWTGLEVWRSYLLTGYAANTLAHTLYQQPVLLQIADQCGGYGVSFVIVSVSVGVFLGASWLGNRESKIPWFSVGWPCILFISTIAYGLWKMQEGEHLAAERQPLLRTVLVQENAPSMFDSSAEIRHQAWESYLAQSAAAATEARTLDLMVWPESTFTGNEFWMKDESGGQLPPELVQQKVDIGRMHETVTYFSQAFDKKIRMLQDVVRGAVARGDGAPTLPFFLLGNDAAIVRERKVDKYNAAFLVDSDGKIVNRYDKIHLVMFGEYIPLSGLLSFLGDAFSFQSATFGAEPKCFEVKGVEIAPSICFESMMPHFVAWQMRQLRAKGHNPEMLITITNDSWFRGSSLLDYHLASEVLVAVEMRRPMLVAANTGLSAWIEGSGKIVEVSNRLEKAYIVAECKKDSRFGMTQLWADAPGWCLALISAVALLSPVVGRRRAQDGRSSPDIHKSGQKND